jgi:cytochrome b561
MHAPAEGRYHGLAILLHWVMALSFLLMLASGLVMANLKLEPALKFNLYQWHKSLGVLLLLAFVARLLVRILTLQPALPAKFAGWEIVLAKISHSAMYALMLLVPLAGWVMVSSSVYGLPTIVFGWFEWPHIPGIAGNEAISHQAREVHELLAITFLALILLHVGAVIKHAVWDKENLLPRMGIGKGESR